MISPPITIDQLKFDGILIVLVILAIVIDKLFSIYNNKKMHYHITTNILSNKKYVEDFSKRQFDGKYLLIWTNNISQAMEFEKSEAETIVNNCINRNDFSINITPANNSTVIKQVDDGDLK